MWIVTWQVGIICESWHCKVWILTWLGVQYLNCDMSECAHLYTVTSPGWYQLQILIIFWQMHFYPFKIQIYSNIIVILSHSTLVLWHQLIWFCLSWFSSVFSTFLRPAFGHGRLGHPQLLEYSPTFSSSPPYFSCLGKLPRLKFCFSTYFGITRRNI